MPKLPDRIATSEVPALLGGHKVNPVPAGERVFRKAGPEKPDRVGIKPMPSGTGTIGFDQVGNGKAVHRAPPMKKRTKQ